MLYQVEFRRQFIQSASIKDDIMKLFSQLKIDEYATYIIPYLGKYRNGKLVATHKVLLNDYFLAGHAECFVIYKRKYDIIIIRPIKNAKFYVPGVFKNYNIYQPYLSQLVEGNVDSISYLQGDSLSCGSFALCYATILLELQKRNKLLMVFNLNGKKIFLPPPEVLKYSQIRRYNIVLYWAIRMQRGERCKITSARGKTLVVTPMVELFDNAIKDAQSEDKSIVETLQQERAKFISLQHDWLKRYEVVAEELKQFDGGHNTSIYQESMLHRQMEEGLRNANCFKATLSEMIKDPYKHDFYRLFSYNVKSLINSAPKRYKYNARPYTEDDASSEEYSSDEDIIISKIYIHEKTKNPVETLLRLMQEYFKDVVVNEYKQDYFYDVARMLNQFGREFLAINALGRDINIIKSYAHIIKSILILLANMLLNIENSPQLDSCIDDLFYSIQGFDNNFHFSVEQYMTSRPLFIRERINGKHIEILFASDNISLLANALIKNIVFPYDDKLERIFQEMPRIQVFFESMIRGNNKSYHFEFFFRRIRRLAVTFNSSISPYSPIAHHAQTVRRMNIQYLYEMKKYSVKAQKKFDTLCGLTRYDRGRHTRHFKLKK